LARHALGKALNSLRIGKSQPSATSTRRRPTGAALCELKAEGKCPKELEHRQVNSLNNVVEADHGTLKQLIKPVRGFKTLKTAHATIKGFEIMRALRKGNQPAIFKLIGDVRGEARIVALAFGVGAKALTQVVAMLAQNLESQTAWKVGL
jgi:hypothetical protein